MRTRMLKPLIWVALLSSISACSKSATSSSGTSSTAVEDSSASSAAANSAGSAIASSDSSGTVSLRDQQSRPLQLVMELIMPRAFASNACPTILTANGSGCANTGNDVNLTYSSCNFGSSAATWSGTLEVSLSSAAMISCGTFPDVSALANNVSIQRQFVSGASPGTATRTSSAGTVVTIDDASANLANFDTGTTISANIGSGYGTQVVFDGSGHRKQVVVAERVYSSKMDHSVTGTLTISESGTTRTVTGSVSVYHNKLKVVGTSTFNSVVYDRTCCHPISGSITTAYAAGAHVTPTNAGTSYVGKSETLTFSSCGSATLTDAITGASTAVSESGCY